MKTLELTWAADAKRRPAPEELAITTLDAQGTASSWWNNLAAVKQAREADGLRRWQRPTSMICGQNTCGIVVSVAAAKTPRITTCPRCGR